MKCRKRVERHRKNKKEMKKEALKKERQESYRTKSAARKATTKTRKSLPLSSSKRNHILHRIVHSLDSTDQEIFNKKPVEKRNNGKGLNSELIVAVHKFYEDDEISHMSPNVKDCRFSKNPSTGEKEIVQIRHLCTP